MVALLTALKDLGLEPSHLFAFLIVIVSLYFAQKTMEGKKKNTQSQSDKERRAKVLANQSLIIEKLETIEGISKWLKEVHSVKNDDGVYAWYVSRDLRNQIERSTLAVSSLERTLDKILTMLDKD